MSNCGEKRVISPSVGNQCVIPIHEPILNVQVSSRRQAPASRTKSRIQYSPVLDLGQVEDAIGLDLDIVGVERLLQNRGDLRTKVGGTQTVERRRPVNGRARVVVLRRGWYVG